MKMMGLIGGVSPESTVLYYRYLNAAARAHLGGDHSARLVISSLDFGHIHQLYRAQDWDGFEAEVIGAARQLEAAGCAGIAILSNTTHMAADAVAGALGIPVISLFDALASAIAETGAKRPLLLGTPFVMEGDFYRKKLERDFDIPTLVPDVEDRAEVNRVIFDELVHGKIDEASRAAYLRIIETGRSAGADSVILGCTEIGMLIQQRHCEMPVFDTTALHAATISRFMLGN